MHVRARSAEGSVPAGVGHLIPAQGARSHAKSARAARRAAGDVEEVPEIAEEERVPLLLHLKQVGIPLRFEVGRDRVPLVGRAARNLRVDPLELVPVLADEIRSKADRDRLAEGRGLII